MEMDIQNDIIAVWQNTVITRDSRDQGWFKFSGFHTSFDSEAQLMAHFSELKRLLTTTYASMPLAFGEDCIFAELK